MLAELMRLKSGIAVAGSHGKTTTTSLVAQVLGHAGLDPTAVVGGRLKEYGTNAKLGKGEWMVVEADESDGSFLKLSPTLAVVTNVDPEHLDHFGSLEALRQAFITFANNVPFYGLAVLCLDHPTVQGMIPEIEKRHTTYGLSSQAHYRGSDVALSGYRSVFAASRGGENLGKFELPMVGEHNVLNALAAIAVADELSIPVDVTREALRNFRGVDRRFTVRGEAGGVTVVDDYGHHPAEIRATLAGARAAFGRRLVVVFQPHRYTRTRDLLEEFATAFNEADAVVVTEIYPSGEEPIAGIDGATVAEALRRHGHQDAHFVKDRSRLPGEVLAKVGKGDLVLTLGAGDITKLGAELLAGLSSTTAGGMSR
jgi:UDP-N-acetylmuramate--alanine ligase